MSKFNVANSLVQGHGYAYQNGTFTGTHEQFWPDALPATPTTHMGATGS